MRASSQKVRLAVIGDVHGFWSPAADAAALRALNADMAIFVGDFGNEQVDIVSQVAQLDHAKAVLLGNHDAWFTMRSPVEQLPGRGMQLPARSAATSTSVGDERSQAQASSSSRDSDSAEHLQVGAKSSSCGCVISIVGPQDRNGVDEQLEALGDCHIGYTSQRVPGKRASIVGARPFSKGGKSWSGIANFMSVYYGVGSMKESEERVVQAVTQTPADDVVVLVGHNGPLGMGKKPSDPCGVDWEGPKGRDHGDPDLRAALDRLHAEQRPVAAVIFGHMHHKLQAPQGRRRMVHVDANTGTVLLNSATVPRIRASNGVGAARQHHFLTIDVDEGLVMQAADVWVQVQQLSDDAVEGMITADGSRNVTAGAAPASYAAHVVEEHVVLQTLCGERGVVRKAWDAHRSRWDLVVMSDDVSQAWWERTHLRARIAEQLEGTA